MIKNNKKPNNDNDEDSDKDNTDPYLITVTDQHIVLYYGYHDVHVVHVARDHDDHDVRDDHHDHDVCSVTSEVKYAETHLLQIIRKR